MTFVGLRRFSNRIAAIGGHWISYVNGVDVELLQSLSVVTANTITRRDCQ